MYAVLNETHCEAKSRRVAEAVSTVVVVRSLAGGIRASRAYDGANPALIVSLMATPILVLTCSSVSTWLSDE